ncbi:hypothetical protein ROZALSC1DRAFT_24603 [Rozella allomycis CSF55]|uniref:Uncharacterized protein n=1 Tax=Rozella allomycis (strain CSF55) TaxID=988480 RepID=A0A4P9YD49_ROZAC|nr:hypothetical protein ROZALSC1DRAFT_24603 [Rozella allomycis CSF55]
MSKLLINACYLDGGTIIGPSHNVKEVFDLIAEEGPKMGLGVNNSKCEIYLQTRHFPKDIKRANNLVWVLLLVFSAALSLRLGLTNNKVLVAQFALGIECIERHNEIVRVAAAVVRDLYPDDQFNAASSSLYFSSFLINNHSNIKGCVSTSKGVNALFQQAEQGLFLLCLMLWGGVS